MRRLIIVSNRLPVKVTWNEEDGFSLLSSGSAGGLATGLGAFHDTYESLWVGWVGMDGGGSDADQRTRLSQDLLDHQGCLPIFLSSSDIEDYYRGFSNSTLWPLMHYFTQYAKFDERTWESYVRVNQIFCDAVLEHMRPDDVVWIQDYHLMLLPAMIRNRMPKAKVGWFLHVPFPSSEIFRMLPHRTELLNGVLGANLIGFHTHDYARHFLESCRCILGVQGHLGNLSVNNRLVVVDAFPMGIDYERFSAAVRNEEVVAEARRISERTKGCKVVLSIDRLDYSKGIPNRLRTYRDFLERYPEWHGKVTLLCVVVPSREGVDTYRSIKREVDRLVGEINGHYATIDWMPILYRYVFLSFTELCSTYLASDVALVTPLRDGMNLIAKEYLAVHDGVDGKGHAETHGETSVRREGVLVLSELAGASEELGDALLVNPFNIKQVGDALHKALSMGTSEMRRRNLPMQHRLGRYTVFKWAQEFLRALDETSIAQQAYDAHILSPARRDALVREYHDAKRRLLMLDYDGTLVPFSTRPKDATPPSRLLETLVTLGSNPANDLVIISGRDRETMDKWFGGLPADLVAEHGAWLRLQGGEWMTSGPLDDAWKSMVKPIFEMYADRTPGAVIEEKGYSLAWHYRQSNADFAVARVAQLKSALSNVLHDSNLSLLEGAKVLEVRDAHVDKGRAAYRWLGEDSFGFILVAGDDHTDEDMFSVAPEDAWTIKIGAGATGASYSLRSFADMRALLELLGMSPHAQS